ncbi:Histidine kinase [Catalinimonas alkaloidigena]|uniref:Histidine kinase n=1 Tax=Catalinimonas alkaloidigena TaxID=1075417 RepID=A0A1G9DLW6_9BACT|nr:histidine kinase [Catalinimonas alkaloidigena]SDK64820.1 Histidine kinase [Catalinimonas alkaloidigena]
MIASKRRTSQDRRVEWIGIPVLGMVLSLIFGGRSLSWSSMLSMMVIFTLFTAFGWIGNGRIVDALRARFPSIQQTPQRLLFQILACTAYTVGGYVLLYPILVRVVFQVPPELPGLESVVFTLIITTAVTSIFEATYFFQRWKLSVVESEQLKRQTVQSQLESLKTQVSPHFLFNSLNTLATLIPEDPALSVQFVEKLSEVYRYLLQNRTQEVVLLATELNFVNAYLFLLRIRFAESLRVDVAVPDEEQRAASVPPIVVQMLVENAVKHNIVSRQRPLYLHIGVEGDALVVRNTLQRKPVRPEESTGVGLANIRTRYRFLTNQELILQETDREFIVRLPLLRVVQPAERAHPYA